MYKFCDSTEGNHLLCIASKRENKKREKPFDFMCPSQDIPLADSRFWIPGWSFPKLTTGAHT
ncbi:hypothetical protein I79_004059 [Cricetulus griseus]|uniref:Uncharacterized protein n=1 Tax=Cricetulus griseus TaxID=10029 RepID=G3H1L1_CRIGR|nr:hypothetical protein I79_004059 [Cricetulus griseus]